MKVNIGPYLNWIGPYQIVDTIFFWHEKYPEAELDKRWDYVLHKRLAKWLASTWVSSFCSWIYEKRQRKIKIHIDKYDTWSIDSTLSYIVVPMLKQLREYKHSAGHVDDKDVPANLRSTTKEAKKSKKEPYDTDCYYFDRWNWVLDEMIWAHEQIIDEKSDDQFWLEHGEIDWDAGEPDENGCTPLIWKKESKVDWDGLKAHEARIQNGLRLFGVYYRSLWD